MRTLGWRLVLGFAVVLFLRYVYDGDGWRALGLFLVVLLVLDLRQELTGEKRSSR